MAIFNSFLYVYQRVTIETGGFSHRWDPNALPSAPSRHSVINLRTPWASSFDAGHVFLKTWDMWQFPVRKITAYGIVIYTLWFFVT
jgi:hypothetical protein